MLILEGMYLGLEQPLQIALPLWIRGRYFSSEDIRVINDCIVKHFDKGRTYISRVICNQLDWKQPNGWLKDRACRDVLLKLETLGLVKLPPSHKRLGKNPVKKRQITFDIETVISEFPSEIHLELAKGNFAEQIWNAVVDEYHYLKHSVAVGRCLKYLVKSEDKLLGAIAFSSPAWRLAPRDSLLLNIGIEPDQIRDIVINNSRFLILPNVQVPNLASSILSTSTRQIVTDWFEYYSIRPLVVETFVQPSLFLGTCYRAANWIEIGKTKGYAKKGSSYHNSQEPKDIFLYGLNRHIRRQLKKLWKNDLELSQ